MNRYIKGFLFLLIGWVLSLCLIFSFIDIIMSAFRFETTNFSGTDVEYIEERGYAPTRGYQNYGSYINSNGLRRGELPAIVPDEIRILTVGDSSCMSICTVLGQDWPTVIERELRSAGVPATTMNGGYSGYRMKNIFLAFRWFKERLQVNLVLIHGGWNDMWPWDKTFDYEFDMEETAKEFFPNWPESLDPHPDYIPYDVPDANMNNIFEVPVVLGALSTTSPLVSYVSTKFLPKLKFTIDRHNENIPVDQPQKTLQSRSERYMFYLGMIIREAQKSNIPVVMIRPFCSFRIKEFNDPISWKILAPLNSNDIPLLQSIIKRMDDIQDFYAEHTKAIVIDPTEYLLQYINTENIHQEFYMATETFHTMAKTDQLLGEYVASQLIEKKLVTPISNKPWIHPQEIHPIFEYRHPELELKLLNWKLWIAAFSVGLILELIGTLIVLASFERIDTDSFILSGWELGVGLIIPFSFTLIGYQFGLPLSGTYITIWIVLSIFSLYKLNERGVLTKSFLLRLMPQLTFYVALSTCVLIAIVQAGLPLIRGSRELQSVLKDLAAWIHFLQDQHIFGRPKVLYYNVHQTAISLSGVSFIPLKLFETLIPRITFYAPVSPLLAVTWINLTGFRAEEILLLLMGLSALAVASPFASIACGEKRRTLTRILSIVLFVVTITLTAYMMSPVFQLHIVSMGLIAYLSAKNDFILLRSIVIIILCGVSTMLPLPHIVLSLLGLGLFYTLHRMSGNRLHVRDLKYVIVFTIFVISGHIVLFRFIPINLDVFDNVLNLGLMPQVFIPRIAILATYVIVILAAVTKIFEWNNSYLNSFNLVLCTLPFFLCSCIMPSHFEGVPLIVYLSVMASNLKYKRMIDANDDARGC